MALLELTTANFEQTISKGITLVDYWAPWCGPCRMLGPTIEDLASSADGFSVGKLNVDENPEIAEKYDIRSIPTIIIFKDGQIAHMAAGLTTKAALLQRIEAVKNS